jgi:hypothetical protein
MASVNFMKLKGAASVAAILRHCAKDTREKSNHKNKDIDQTRTRDNTDAGTYQQMYDRFRLRIKELDATTNKNKRRDRVLCFALETPVPEGLKDRKDEENWCGDVILQFINRFGKDNLVGFAIHRDERHEYTTADGEKKMSRTHLHCFVVPEINGQLNGKQFSSKKAMIDINREIDRMTKEKYHLAYMTHETARHQRVEKLKKQSLEKELDQLKKRAYEELDDGTIDRLLQLCNELKLPTGESVIDLFNREEQERAKAITWLKDPDRELPER